MTAHALDISGHQKALLGKVRQFLAMQRPGRPELVVCKATEAQGFVDSTFVPFILELEAEHVEHLLAYHFAWGNRSGSAQARHFFQTAAGVVRTQPCLDLEGCYDWKTKRFTDLDEVGPVKLVESYWDLGRETEQLWGRECIAYTGPGWIDTLIAEARKLGVDLRDHPAARWFAARKLWCAHYTEGAPLVPTWWRDQGQGVWMHQYTGSHPCDLVPGLQLDWNRCYDVTASDPHRDTIPPTLLSEQPQEYMAVQCDSAAQCLELVQRPGGQELEDEVEALVAGVLGAWHTLPASPTPTRPETPSSKSSDRLRAVREGFVIPADHKPEDEIP